MRLRASAVAIFLIASAAVASGKDVLPFVENDYAKAVARARSKDLPIFVDAWAPW